MPEILSDLNWPHLEWCIGPHLHTIEPPGPVTALWSVPGSGNTWVRYLIQHVTGYFTGAIYNDNTLKKSDFPGEGKTDGTVIAIKDHR